MSTLALGQRDASGDVTRPWTEPHAGPARDLAQIEPACTEPACTGPAGSDIRRPSAEPATEMSSRHPPTPNRSMRPTHSGKPRTKAPVDQPPRRPRFLWVQESARAFCPCSASPGWCGLYGLVSLLLVGSMGCGGKRPLPTPPGPPQVTFVEAKAVETVDYDEYLGRSEPSETVEVRSRVYGYLQSVEFRDGDQVKEGQVLYKIEPEDYQAAHQQSLARVVVAESQSVTAKAKLARSEQLLPAGAISREEYDEAAAIVKETEAAIAAAKADAARSELELKYTQLTSPIDGQIDRTLITPGNLVTGGMTDGTLLARIVKTSPLYIYFDIDEASLLRYRRLRGEGSADRSIEALRDENIPVRLRLDDETDFPHVATLDFVENRLSASSGTIKLRAVFENAEREIPAGAFVRVQMPASAPYQATAIPERAIATDQSVKYVYVIDAEGVARRRNLRLGPARGSDRLVLEGVQPGERVVLEGLQRVRPDMPVAARADSANTVTAPAAETTPASPAEPK